MNISFPKGRTWGEKPLLIESEVYQPNGIEIFRNACKDHSGN